MQKKMLAYRYDGSFEGFLCCVFDSFYRRELPAAILPDEMPQETLYPEHWVETDKQHAERVYNSFRSKISPATAAFIAEAFLSCQPEKERLLLRFIRLGYRYRGAVLDCLVDDTVNALTKAVKYLNNEAHFLRNFCGFRNKTERWLRLLNLKTGCFPYWLSISVPATRKSDFSFLTAPTGKLWCTSLMNR